jgi:hypothetical protein
MMKSDYCGVCYWISLFGVFYSALFFMQKHDINHHSIFPYMKEMEVKKN